MRNYFKKELGIDVFFEPKKFKINSKKFFIGHGDGLGPGDYGYKFLKLIFRNSFFKFLFSCIHPDISIRIGEYLSRKNSVISGKEIKLQNLNYWNVDLQEAYFSPIEANERFKKQKK